MNYQLHGGPIILFVDDDDPLARDLREKLVAAGYFVHRAASGQEALIGPQAANADLILLSLMLPDTDGMILCASLKARTSAPIVVLSQRPRGVDRALALELGAADVVGAPVDIDTLLARIPETMGQSVSRAAAAARA